MRLLDRLPEGTVAVGGGLMVNGLAAYAFITLASRDLGPEAYTPVGLLWALSFLLGPGFFQPLEQEVARVLASRADGRLGPVVRTAAFIGAGMVGVLAVGAFLLRDRLQHDLFDGDGILVVGFLLVLVGLGLGHLVRGALAGVGRFGGYARGAAVFILSDGLERGEPDALRDAVAKLSRRAWRVSWLTPLATSAAFRPQTEALVAIERFVDDLVDGGSSASIVAHVLALGRRAA